jgi:hypothetical protein
MKRARGVGTAFLTAVLLAAGLSELAGPAAANPAGPTSTKVLCAHVVAEPPGEYLCSAVVADADPGLDPPPSGFVGFYLDGINTPEFLAQCPLTPLSTPGPGGIAGCQSALPVPSGPHTVWAIYYGDGPYQKSVGSDDVGNPPSTPKATDARVVCAATTAAATAQPLDCTVLVAGDDTEVGPALSGSVGLFRDGVNVDTFVGHCAMTPAEAGMSACRTLLMAPIRTGPGVTSVLYFGDPSYDVSADTDRAAV